MTKTEMRELRKDLQKAMDEVLSKRNLVASIGTITSYSRTGTHVTFKTEISEMTNQHGRVKLDLNAKALLGKLPELGMKPEVFNEPFMFKHSKIRIKGYNTRARKYPVEYTKDGENYKCSVDFMKQMVLEAHPEYFL